ncbi:MAG: hypothetical protein IJN14_08985 [Ruminococcus sp.]|nr:hypothetical protein [Ruminococcus sp.]
MNNNDFLKAMSLIDDDLMYEAGVSEDENDSLTEDGTVVSGVDIYHSPVWRRVLAVAATLAIITCTAAGGAYYFSKLDKDTVSEKSVNSSYSDDEKQYNSIYSKLKANREKYTMNTAICLFDSTKGGFPYTDSKEQDNFFDYMDKVNIKNEIDGEQFIKVPGSIKFVFGTAEETCFTFVFYENGCFSLTENDNGSETTEYYRSPDEMNCFNDLLKMYGLDTILPDLNDVGSEEIADMLKSACSLSPDNVVKKSTCGKTVKYEISDKNSLIASLSALDWERVAVDDSDVKNNSYYTIWGIIINEDGYMTGRYKDCKASYKLKNESSLSAIKNAFFSDPTKLLQSYINTINTTDRKTVQWMEGPTLHPQGRMPYDTITRFYTMTDARKIIDGLAELEWEPTTYEDIENNTGYRDDDGIYILNGCYEFGLYEDGPAVVSLGDLFVYPEGYMYIDNPEISSIPSCFKLKNESDKDKMVRLIKENIVIDETSALAEKISSGITNYDNLKAHYTYRSTNTDNPEDEYYMSGELSVDARNEKMYQTGEGRYFTDDDFSEIVMNGHDNSVCKVGNRHTRDAEFMLCYEYSNGSTMPPPLEHYIYICKTIEKLLAPRFVHSYINTDYSTEIAAVNGNTEIKIHTSETDYDNNEITSDITIVITPNGQLISYRYESDNHIESFTLDNYVFDSPDFTMVDTQDMYDRLKKECDSQYE